MPASKNTENILQHKRLVASYMEQVARDLFRRAIERDLSKFGPEEFDAYEEALPRFEKAVYGTPEYIAVCKSIKPAIEHHITTNRHHPEYFGNTGINGMNLVDLVEMVCDWIAASQRGGGNDLMNGLEINKERFHIDDQLFEIIMNTVKQLDPQRLLVTDPLI
jgi:hypothetical protein